MESKIDYDRGVRIRHHSLSGMDIFMYKDEPGVYLNAYGDPVREELAAQCGFPVAKLALQREKKVRMAKAMASIEKELELVDDEFEHKVIKEADGYQMVEIGMGRHIIKAPDGDVLTSKHLTQAEAEAIFTAMISAPDEPEKPTTTLKKPKASPDANPIEAALSKSVDKDK